MAQEPVDLKLYFEVQNLLFVVPANEDSKNKLSKSGSQFIPQIPMCPVNEYDEVYPNLFLGSRKIVQNVDKLKSLGITHMVNASMGPKFNQTSTSQEFYNDSGIIFHGIPAMDVVSFNLFPYLRDAADFIDHALSNEGTVYVHCQMGVSRSASLVLAFLMLKKHLDLISATKLVRAKRLIHPNDGFLKQLCKLQEEINFDNDNIQSKP